MATNSKQLGNGLQNDEHDWDADIPPVRFVTPEEGRETFDYRARKQMGMRGQEFLRRWDAGEFADASEGPDHLKLVDVMMLIPLVRQNPE